MRSHTWTRPRRREAHTGKQPSGRGEEPVTATPHGAIAGLTRAMGGAHRHHQHAITHEVVEVDAVALTKLRCAFPRRRREGAHEHGAPPPASPRLNLANVPQLAPACKRKGHTAPLLARLWPNHVPRDAAGPPRQIETQEAPIHPRSFKVVLVDVEEEGSAEGVGEWREGAGAGATATLAAAPRHWGRGRGRDGKSGRGGAGSGHASAGCAAAMTRRAPSSLGFTSEQEVRGEGGRAYSRTTSSHSPVSVSPPTTLPCAAAMSQNWAGVAGSGARGRGSGA